jgi:hypothetical protein
MGLFRKARPRDERVPFGQRTYSRLTGLLYPCTLESALRFLACSEAIIAIMIVAIHVNNTSTN